MPSQLAHDVVGFALDYTGKTVDSIKSKPGLLSNIVTRVEGPVCKTLEHRAVKTVLKVGDQVLTTVDGTIDKALTSTYYKSGESYVKSTYSNRIVPATNTVTTTVTTTTNRVTTPIVNVYTGVLSFADKQVRSVAICLISTTCRCANRFRSQLPRLWEQQCDPPLFAGATISQIRTHVHYEASVRPNKCARIILACSAAKRPLSGLFDWSTCSSVIHHPVSSHRTVYESCTSVSQSKRDPVFCSSPC